MIWVIGLSGSLGAASRYIIGIWVNLRTQKLYPFPTGTWIINIAGSFLLGLITQLHLSGYISESLWLVSGVGFCGAFTTFSTFGYETIVLIQSKETRLAIIYVVTSIIVGVIAAMIGFYI